MTVVLLSADTMLVFGHQGQHKYRSDGITRSVGIMPREPCPLTNIHPNIHVPGQTLAINSNRAPRMRSICPLSVCSSGEYVYVTAEPISLPRSSVLPILSSFSYQSTRPPSAPRTSFYRFKSPILELSSRQFTKLLRSGTKIDQVGTQKRT